MEVYGVAKSLKSAASVHINGYMNRLDAECIDALQVQIAEDAKKLPKNIFKS